MKKICFILLYFYCNWLFSQQSYKFNYYTIYEFKTDSLAEVSIKEVFFSNSNDKDYLLALYFKSDTIFSASLIDFKKQKINIFKDQFYVNNLNDTTLFKTSFIHDYKLDNCKKSKKRFYEIYYDTLGIKKTITINQFKNNKKKKMINSCILNIKNSEISKKQQYNFGQLVNPLWCEKFRLEDIELIESSYFIENGSKKNIRKLIEINKTNLVINTTTTQ